MFDQKVTENASKVHAGGTDLGIVIYTDDYSAPLIDFTQQGRIQKECH